MGPETTPTPFFSRAPGYLTCPNRCSASEFLYVCKYGSVHAYFTHTYYYGSDYYSKVFQHIPPPSQPYVSISALSMESALNPPISPCSLIQWSGAPHQHHHLVFNPLPLPFSDPSGSNDRSDLYWYHQSNYVWTCDCFVVLVVIFGQVVSRWLIRFFIHCFFSQRQWLVNAKDIIMINIKEMSNMLVGSFPPTLSTCRQQSQSHFTSRSTLEKESKLRYNDSQI